GPGRTAFQGDADRLRRIVHDRRQPLSRAIRRSEAVLETAGRFQRSTKGIQLRYGIRTGTCELHRQVSQCPAARIRRLHLLVEGKIWNSARLEHDARDDLSASAWKRE